MKNKDVAIITGDFINALSVYKSIKRLNFKGEIYVVKSSRYNLLPVIYKNNLIEVEIEKSNDIISFIKDFPKITNKYLFLTNEIYHQTLFDCKDVLKEHNTFFYFGNRSPFPLFNKAKFSTLFKDNKLVTMPQTLELEHWNDNILGFPLVLKFKKSFKGELKTLPVKIISSQNEMTIYLNYINKKGFDNTDLIVQEKLSSKAEDNISITGWYSNTDEFYYQTRKILQHPNEGGTGDLVELINLDPRLKEISKSILNELDYNGPFEIEFIKSQVNDQFVLLELNPRFWMQHGLIERLSGDRIVSNYLSLEANHSKKYKYWVNLPHYITLLLKFNKKAWRYLPKVIFQSYSPISLKELLIYVIRK